MKRIDWQAYLDGSLDPESRRIAEDLLQRNEQARRELEGLQCFQATVREKASGEELPTERLETLLHKAAYRRKFSVWRVAGVIGPVAAAAAAAYLVFVYDPMRLDRSPAYGIIETTDAGQAANWVSRNTGFKTPVVDLGSEATLVVSRYGKNWGCYDYMVGDHIYYVYMSPNSDPLHKASKTSRIGGRTLYLGRGVGWEQKNLAFYIRGGEDEVRLQLAHRISSIVESWNASARRSTSLAIGSPDVLDLCRLAKKRPCVC